jgi:hypothetical protein
MKLLYKAVFKGYLFCPHFTIKHSGMHNSKSPYMPATKIKNTKQIKTKVMITTEKIAKRASNGKTNDLIAK